MYEFEGPSSSVPSLTSIREGPKDQEVSIMTSDK